MRHYHSYIVTSAPLKTNKEAPAGEENMGKAVQKKKKEEEKVSVCTEDHYCLTACR